MNGAVPFSRRRVMLTAALGLAAAPRLIGGRAGLTYRLATELCQVRLSVEFHDLLTGRDRWLLDSLRRHSACPLETRGGCMFTGSAAIVRYEILPRAGQLQVLRMREDVRTIDWDSRLAPRPQFQRTVELERGVASDVQAFGHDGGEEAKPGVPVLSRTADPAGPWYYFRQDLYLAAQQSPFLILHWKHSLEAILLLDVIPSNGTILISE